MKGYMIMLQDTKVSEIIPNCWGNKSFNSSVCNFFFTSVTSINEWRVHEYLLKIMGDVSRRGVIFNEQIFLVNATARQWISDT